MDNQASNGVGIAPPEPNLSAAAVVELVAQVAALLASLGFRVYGYAGQEGRLPPVTSECQNVDASWQGPTKRFSFGFSGFPQLGWAKVYLEAHAGCLRTDAYFTVHQLADVQFLLDNWEVLSSERTKAANGELGLIALLQESPPGPPLPGSEESAALVQVPEEPPSAVAPAASAA